jgi:hypothetical protein
MNRKAENDMAARHRKIFVSDVDDNGRSVLWSHRQAVEVPERAWLGIKHEPAFKRFDPDPPLPHAAPDLPIFVCHGSSHLCDAESSRSHETVPDTFFFPPLIWPTFDLA